MPQQHDFTRPNLKGAVNNIDTETSPRTDYLDGWRGVSILCVLQGHFIALPIPVDFGRFGVCMFFALSGMLMSNLLFIERQPLSKFYRRRISRIVPTFVLFVTTMFTLSGLWNTAFSWNEFISTLLFTRTYFPYPGIWKTEIPIGHIWSLNIEEHSYIFMSFLTLLPFLKRREGPFLIAGGATCIVIGFIYVRLGSSAPFWGPLGTEVAASFLLMSAGYRLVCDRVRQYVPPWLPVLSLVLAMYLSQGGSWWMQPMASPVLLAFAVNHLPETRPWFKTLLSSQALRLAGLCSFSIYLWQQPFFSTKAIFPGGPYSALACAVIVSLLSYHLVEKPSRTWLNRNWKSWLPVQAVQQH